jgi:membrane AbrB-like protein
MSRLLERAWAQWVLLIATTAGLVVGLKALHAPAALLLAPLVVGVVFGVGGATIRPPPLLRVASSTLIGCLVAVALGSAMGPALLGRLPTFLCIGVVTLGLSLGLGWLLGRAGWFEGSTAVWGLSPGGSASMIALAQETGADARIVALMQYFRVLLVASSAIALAHLAAPPPSGHPHYAGWLPPLDLPGLLGAAVLCLAGGVLAKVLRFPAGVFLIPGLTGAALLATGRFHLQVPPVLAAAAYAVVGWTIGLSFTRPTLLHSARALPRIVGATLLLILLCAASGLLVSLACDVDLLTGYLATSPGGVDSILIIAASTPVDLPFILAAQVVRIILVLLIGPYAAQALARGLAGREPEP